MKSNIKEKKRVSLRAPKPGHVIAAIAYFLPMEFSCDTRAWHLAIKALQNEEDYGNLLQEFIFLDRQPFSYSPLLERALKNLIEARLLYIRSPKCKKYCKTETSPTTLGRIVEKFNTKEQEKLKDMASNLEKVLKEGR